MPIFEYKCRSCSHEFETLVRPHLPAPQCPECGSADLEKLVSSPAVSTESMRQANARKSRQQQIAKRKDAIVAEEEHRIHHDD
jgi:putative FmdB family regulatory protein